MEISQEQIVDIAQELNVSPVIVQQCIQQNAGRDIIDVVENDSNNNEDIDVIDERFDDRNEVLAASIPDKLLPNTGGITLVAGPTVLALICTAAALSVGYAVVRRRS